MRRLNLNSVGLGLLLAAFVLILMSFEDPFRVCLCALLLSVHGPTWRLIHAAADRPSSGAARSLSDLSA